MRLLTWGASASRKSINQDLAWHAAERFREYLPDAHIERLDLNEFEMPIYSIDREREGGIPEPAKRFYSLIGEADGLVVSFAEHNGAYTSAFKNVFDWASRIDARVYQGKPLVALATSPGRRGGAGVLKLAVGAAPHFGAEVVGSLSVPLFGQNFDVDAGVIREPEIARQLGRLLESLAGRMLASRG